MKGKIFLIISVIISLLVLSSAFYIYNERKHYVSVSCSPGQKRCIGQSLESCWASGKGWSIADQCDYGCTNGACAEDNTCYPFTCTSRGKECGNWANGCGGTLNCGSCYSQEVCSSGSCLASCIPDTCEDLGKSCGTYFDGCQENIYCGTCPSGYSCQSGRCEKLLVNVPTFSEYYSTLRKNSGISDDYLKETWDYDYSNLPVLFDETNRTILGLFYGDEFVPALIAKAATDFVYQKVDYDLDYATGSYCYTNSASMIYHNGKGVCSTMSKLTVALMRSMGLAAREVTGCAVSDVCEPYLSIISPEPIKEGKKYVIAGGLHTWVEVWLPDTGWTIAEPTNGALYLNGCVDYDAYVKEGNFNEDIDGCTCSEYYGNKCFNS